MTDYRKLERGAKIANEKLGEILNEERMTANEKVHYMSGLMYGLGKAKMLDARDMIDMYLYLEKKLGVKILTF